MKKTLPFWFTLLTLTIVAITVSFPKSPQGSEITSHLEERLTDLRTRYDIPGVGAALIREGEVVWTGHFGYADRNEEVPVTEDTLFRAESITKPLTARAVMNLVEEGRLALDDPVEDYLTRWQLPETEYSESEVTVRGLLSHSSGLTGGSDYVRPGEVQPPLEEVLDGKHGLHQTRLVRKPGLKFEYSNQAFVVLQLLVEEITESNYEQYLQREVLRPLGVNAHFKMERDVRDRLATSYSVDGEPVPFYVDVAKTHAGMLITPKQLAKLFAAGLLDSQNERSAEGAIGPDSLQAMYTPVIEPEGFYALGAEAVGLGHFIDFPAEEEKGIFHAGEGTGSLGIAYIFPQKGEGLVLLTNSKGGWPFLLKSLDEWSSTAGLPRPSMASIFSYLATGVFGLTILVIIVATIKTGLLLNGFLRGGKTFAPLSKSNRISRALQALAAPSILVLWWYLGNVMLHSFLPVRYGRLGLALAILGGALFVSSLFAEKTEAKTAET